MRTNRGYGTRTSRHPIVACALFIGSALAGHGGQFGDFTYEEYDTTIEITGYRYDATGDVIIPSEIVGKPATSIADRAFERRQLTSVTIPDSVTSIGDGAFWACDSLTSVNFGSGVGSIGDGSFARCDSLTSVTIPSNVTSIGEGAFASCSNLTAITVNAANSVYSSMDGAVFDKTQTTLVIFPSGQAGSFSIPSNVTSIGDGAFAHCRNLTSVTIGSSVNSIGDRAFWFCDSLISVTISGSVTAIQEGTFFACNSLTSVTIGNGVTSIGEGAFAVCTSLINLAIPDSVTSIGEYAFSDCTSLTSITIPDSVTRIGAYAFEICTSLTSVTIPDSVTTIGDGAFLVCKSLPSVAIPESVTSIGYRAFFGCASLTSVTIPVGVTHIGDEAFRACSGLTAITVNEANITYSSVEGVLFDKSQTTLMQLPGGKTGNTIIPDSVTRIMVQAFRNCDSVKDVTLSASAKVNLEEEVCREISITMGSGVTKIEPGTYGGCTNLTGITIGTGVTRIEDWAFHDCDNLRVVTIPGNVTSIGERAFVDCSNLDAIYFEGNAPTFGSSIFERADNATVYYLGGATGWSAEFGGRPTEEISVLPDRLIGGTPVDDQGGWFLSEWWGAYNPVYAPWLFHAEHGYIYRDPSSTNASQYFYDDAMGAWWWTNQAFYPFIYAFNPPADNEGTDIGSAWLFFFDEGNDPRVFGVVTGDQAGSLLFFDP